MGLGWLDHQDGNGVVWLHGKSKHVTPRTSGGGMGSGRVGNHVALKSPDSVSPLFVFKSYLENDGRLGLDQISWY
jgi:hypothetical protein